jgi:ribosomal protein L15E
VEAEDNRNIHCTEETDENKQTPSMETSTLKFEDDDLTYEEMILIARKHPKTSMTAKVLDISREKARRSKETKRDETELKKRILTR